MIAGVSAVVLFILMFLPWVGISGPDVSGLPEGVDASKNFNLWEASDSLDIYLLITIVVALLGVFAASGGGVNLPLPAGIVTALLGGIGTILVLVELIAPPGDLDRKYAMFLGLIAVAGIAVGGWMTAQEEEVA